MSRREKDSLGMVRVSFPRFVEDIFGGSPGESHDGESRIFVGAGYERRAISDEEIFDIVGLAEAVENGSFRIGAHAGGADFVNNSAASFDAVGVIAMDRGASFVFAAHGFDDGAESFLHVLGLKQFVIGPFEMKTQNGNAPLIHDAGIDFEIAIRIGNNFAASAEADVTAVGFARALL